MPSRYTQCGKFLFISHCCGQSLAKDGMDEWGGYLPGCSLWVMLWEGSLSHMIHEKAGHQHHREKYGFRGDI